MLSTNDDECTKNDLTELTRRMVQMEQKEGSHGRRMFSEFRSETEFFTDEQGHIIEIHNTSNDEGCSIIRARVEPGVTALLDAVHGTIEHYIISRFQ